MELLIRSQDRETLTKYDCLSLKKYGVFPNHIIVAHIGNNIIDLGIYKTKERALEVLDEIQRILQPRLMATVRTTDEMQELMGGRSFGKTKTQKQDIDFKELSTYVYEMPEN